MAKERESKSESSAGSNRGKVWWAVEQELGRNSLQAYRDSSVELLMEAGQETRVAEPVAGA